MLGRACGFREYDKAAGNRNYDRIYQRGDLVELPQIHGAAEELGDGVGGDHAKVAVPVSEKGEDVGYDGEAKLLKACDEKECGEEEERQALHALDAREVGKQFAAFVGYDTHSEVPGALADRCPEERSAQSRERPVGEDFRIVFAPSDVREHDEGHG